MRQWDYWRKRIANGDKSSAPRDWFESILDDDDQFRTITAQPANDPIYPPPDYL